MAPPAGVPRSMAALTPDLATLKVLIVDADYGARKLIRSLLAMMGCACVHEASDVAGCLEVIKTSRPDMVLLDWRMPGIAGGDHVRRIRFAAMPHRIPIIMLTRADERSGVPEAVRLGVHDFLLKPVTAGALRARLSSVLAQDVEERAPLHDGERGRVLLPA